MGSSRLKVKTNHFGFKVEMRSLDPKAETDRYGSKVEMSSLSKKVEIWDG